MREQVAADSEDFFIQFCPSTTSKQQQLSSSPNPSTSRPSREQAASKQHP
jgi:hypothetical protein